MSKMVTLYCKTGQHEWQRPSQRGKRPFNCPEHSESVTVHVKPASTNGGGASEDVLARARQIKIERQAQRAREDAERAAQQRATRIAQISEKLPEWEAEYVKAIKNIGDDNAWRKAGQIASKIHEAGRVLRTANVA